MLDNPSYETSGTMARRDPDSSRSGKDLLQEEVLGATTDAILGRWERSTTIQSMTQPSAPMS